MTDKIALQLRRNNIYRFKHLNQITLVLHIAFLFTTDLFNYFYGVWDEFPTEYYSWLGRLISIPVLVFLILLDKSFIDRKLHIIPYRLLLVINLLCWLPIIAIYYLWDINNYTTTSVLIIYILSFAYMIRCAHYEKHMFLTYFGLLYFGTLAYQGISYLENPSLYILGVCILVLYYIISLKLYEVDYESIVNKRGVRSNNEKLSHLNDELESAQRQLSTELKVKILLLNQGKQLIDKLDLIPAKTEDDNVLVTRKDFKEMKSLIRKFKNEYSVENIEEGLLELHSEFVTKLLEISPKLTVNNLKLCILIKLGLSIPEIAQVKYTSSATISVAKNRLRKKLNLDSDISLFYYFNNVIGFNNADYQHNTDATVNT